ncbi:1-acylglycerol-3-phosphate O-acyltransferase Vps66 [Schizosaccharomyces osmophilus]|uniref:1-acylglycerol-3-phosphate O-acyltransferase Vps66 n=1 Tax=Schizosaccharomyces osmophilus TaxID=2545709 RepID=A0AAF0AW50_9SCHI|nr:1-acylglycerol-3-phosphate O-acyltransferase Vps66 [Schizosaccharomyces osmophilus]WBW74281.1 1-acylglycerol-3-phosphate O-acyltransferase Vps66 [Schizosaccharomyces osmophilus]
MEKFTRWRDAGTGIAPFHPIYAEKPSITSLKWLVILLLALIRIPLCIIFGLLYLVIWSAFLKNLLSFQPSISGFLERSFSRILLFSLGCFRLSYTLVGTFVQGDSLQAGDIVAVNHTSPVDILSVSSLFDCVFVQANCKSSNVLPVSSITAFFSCFSRLNLMLSPPKRDLRPLSEICKDATKNGKVVILFPEGSTTNGRGLCKLTKCLESAGSTDRIFCLYIRYLPAAITLSIPSVLTFISSILLTTSFETRARMSAEPEIPKNCNNVTDDVLDKLCKLGRTRATNLDLVEKQIYLEAKSTKYD